MAITLLDNQEPKKRTKTKTKSTRQKEKPNIREYLSEHTLSGNESFPIIKGKVTQSGWLLIETEEWIGFIHSGSSVAENLLDNILPKLNGTKAFSLVAIPSKANKYGFVIGIENELEVYYSFDVEDESFILSEHEITEEGKQVQLTLDMFIATKSASPTSGEVVSLNDKNRSSKAKARTLKEAKDTSTILNTGELPPI